jgi:hypothetical protein
MFLAWQAGHLKKNIDSMHTQENVLLMGAVGTKAVVLAVATPYTATVSLIT